MKNYVIILGLIAILSGCISSKQLVDEKEKVKISIISDNEELQKGFNWAIKKTEQFVITGKTGLINRHERNKEGDGMAEYIPSYWAGYYDRTAFYSRDFVHQAVGGQIAGLWNENYSMFYTFAENSTEERDWWTLWAFNFDGSPHSIDYKNEDVFVKEVPAQFELIEKAYKQYLWSGDKRYINDPVMWNFYTKSLTDFIERHDTRGNGIAEGKGGIWKGSCTYNERGEHPIEAGDGIGCQYQATLAYAKILEERNEVEQAKIWHEKADNLKKYFNEEWSVFEGDAQGHYVRGYTKEEKQLRGFGKENSWFMPLKMITEPGVRNDNYLDFIYEKLGNGIGSTREAPRNIEAYTYIPDMYFLYNRNEEAWKWMKYILSERNLPHERPSQGTKGDYPELSFTIVSQVVEGMAGVVPNAVKAEVSTIPRLPAEIKHVKLENINFGAFLVDVEHKENTSSSLTNFSDKKLTWEVAFYGEHKQIFVDGKALKAQHKKLNGETISYVLVSVGNNKTITAKTYK